MCETKRGRLLILATAVPNQIAELWRKVHILFSFCEIKQIGNDRCLWNILKDWKIADTHLIQTFWIMSRWCTGMNFFTEKKRCQEQSYCGPTVNWANNGWKQCFQCENQDNVKSSNLFIDTRLKEMLNLKIFPNLSYSVVLWITLLKQIHESRSLIWFIKYKEHWEWIGWYDGALCNWYRMKASEFYHLIKIFAYQHNAYLGKYI